MNRFSAMTVAAAAFTGVLAAAPAAHAQQWDRNHDGIDGNAQGGRGDGYDRGRDRNHDGIDGNARDGRRGGRDPNHDGIDGNARGRDGYGRYGRDLNHDGIDGNAARRRQWDRARDNGYWSGGNWYYGPPPQGYYGRADFYPDYRAWRRGDRLPGYYRDSYRGVDWRACRLRPPPNGYRYVEDERGDYLLVAVATGIILSVILSNNY